MFASFRRIDLWFEITAFLLIAFFCLGAWMTRPEKIYSLRKEIDQNQLFQDNLIEARLPKNWGEHFEQERLSTYWLTEEHPLIIDRLSSNNKLDRLNEGSLYFFYGLTLNQRSSQFSLSIGQKNFKTRSLSSIIPTGAAIWRDRLNNIGSPQEYPFIKISVNHPNAQSFLCEFTVYDAPGLALWQ
ncbi:MAG: hypothetical protein P9L94_16730 [Candidatus Hinthialibacter antarcticus]|nr:hypothetical protein [Candidatus Hinthialibacter antarcticus]